MEDAQKMSHKLIIETVEWCDEAALMFVDAVDNCHVADLQAQVNSGATLFKVTSNGLLVGYYILRIDEFIAHSEAVLVAGVGNHPVINLTDSIIPVIEKQFIACKYLRIHTARSGLVKKLAHLGYEPQEFVMRKQINAA